MTDESQILKFMPTYKTMTADIQFWLKNMQESIKLFVEA